MVFMWLLTVSWDTLCNQEPGEQKCMTMLFVLQFSSIILKYNWELCHFVKTWKNCFDLELKCVHKLNKKRYFYVKFAVRPLSREITMSQAYQNMCAGMYKVIYLCLLNNGSIFLKIGIKHTLHAAFVFSVSGN